MKAVSFILAGLMMCSAASAFGSEANCTIFIKQFAGRPDDMSEKVTVSLDGGAQPGEKFFESSRASRSRELYKLGVTLKGSDTEIVATFRLQSAEDKTNPLVNYVNETSEVVFAAPTPGNPVKVQGSGKADTRAVQKTEDGKVMQKMLAAETYGYTITCE